MNYTLSNLVTFAVGAAIGSAVAWKLLKTKYERIAQEEIDSVKEVFSKKKHELEEKDAYEKLAQAYSGEGICARPTKNYNEEVDDLNDDPRIISPFEFGENGDEYEAVSLTYYADGVLADDLDEPIDDIDSVVGSEALNHFGDNESDPDSVYVRNDRMKCDYEILLDTRNYADVKKLYHTQRAED